MYDFVVIGAGIAGIAISELLQRSGRSVLLLEANEKVVSESTAHQQGWFHTGALYAALPNNSFFRIMVGNLDDLFNYYTSFENMNLRVDRNIYTSKNDGWFTNTTNLYAYVSPLMEEVRMHLKLPWWLAIKRAQRRLAWFENLNFKEELSKQIRLIERGVSVNLIKRDGKLNFDLGKLSCVLKSRDRTMDSNLIIGDLLRSFLGNGGELKTGSKASKIEKNRVFVENGDEFEANHIIVASGQFSGELSKINLKITVSPIVVSYPALTTINFVRMTPDISKSINHLFYKIGDYEYSLIGNALYFNLDEIRNSKSLRNEIKGKIFDRMRRVFGERFSEVQSEIYYGIKSEVVNASQFRNYQYHIIDMDTCTIALPGKFSLAFSLAANLCKHFGIDPLRDNLKMASEDSVEHLIARQVHYKLVSEMSKS